MFKYSMLTGVALLITSTTAWGLGTADNIIRNGQEFPVNVTIFFLNKGVGHETIPPGGAIHVMGDIEKLHVFPSELQAGVKPAVCDGVYEMAIDIGAKKSLLKCE